MDIKIITIIEVTYLYGFFEVFMNFRQRGKARVSTSGDKGSLWLLYGLIAVGYSLAFAIGATKIGRIYPWNTFFAIGMAMVVVGLAIRIISIHTLNQSFTYSVAIIEDQKIIDTGFYKYIRHPGYLGQLIIFIGITVSMSNWISVLLMMIPVSIGYLNRMNVEERFMLEQLGEEYKKYLARTKRLFPFLY